MKKCYSLIITIFSVSNFVGFTQYSRASDLVSYFRLRFELTTTSSACELIINDDTHILSGRQIRVSNNTQKAGISFQRLWAASSQPGQSVGVTGDFAITPTAVQHPLPCQFVQRIGGVSSVYVYAMQSNGDSVLLHKVNFFASDTLNFSIDLASLQTLALLTKRLTPVAPQKLLCAFYYPWYFMDDWNSNLLQDYPAIRYSSDDPVAIERHIRQAKSAGIDVFLSSWWGPNSYTDQNLVTLLEKAQQQNFLVAINFETLTTNPLTGETVALDDTTIFAWLNYAISRYGAHPAYLKVDNKPVFVLWASTTVSDSSWANIFDQLRARDKEAMYIGMFNGEDPALNGLEFSNGWHTYNILGVIRRDDQVPTILSQVYTNLGKALHYYPLLTDETTPKIWAATVQPGYDDHLIPGRTSPILPRNNGDLYQSTFAAAMNSNPDWIFITTWNEWWEHTYIEPSERYGDQFLQLTRQYAELWKGHSVSVQHLETATGIPFVLYQSYPNPFNSKTTIKFELPQAEKVMLKIYDLLGREVILLVNEKRTAGLHSIELDTSSLSSGVFFYQLTAGQFTQIKKLLLLK